MSVTVDTKYTKEDNGYDNKLEFIKYCFNEMTFFKNYFTIY